MKYFQMLRIVTRRLATARVLRNDSHPDGDKIGLVDFFRPKEEWAEPDQANAKPAGIAWSPNMIENLTVAQLHELWYILLREKNVINTEKYHHWKTGYVYKYTHDPEEVIAESMANIKDRLKRYNERAEVLNGEKGTNSLLFVLLTHFLYRSKTRKDNTNDQFI